MAKAPTGASASKNEIATQTAAGLPANIMDDLAQHAGEGMERVSLDDVIMPRLKILQALSPECKRKGADYIEGAEPGMICNVATRTLYNEINVVAAAYIRHHIEWVPNRGGFVKDHGDDPSIMDRVVKRDDKHFDILDNGNIIQPTPTWYCILLNEGGDPCVIPMPRTQSKASRQWMSQATSEKLEHPDRGQFPAPLFYRGWRLFTVERTNDDGEWFVWAVERGPSIMDTDEKSGALMLPADTMAKAQAFRKLVTSGDVRATAEHFADDDQNGASRGSGDKTAPM